MLSLIIVYSIIIVFNFKTLFTVAFRIRASKLVWISTFISFAFVVAFIFVNTPAKFSRWNFIRTSQEIFSRFDTVLCIAYNVTCSLLLSYLINIVVRPRMFPTLYETYANLNHEGIDWKYWKNETILQRER